MADTLDFSAFPKTTALARVAEATAEGKTINFGWIPPDKRNAEQSRAAIEAIAAMPRFQIRGRFTLEQRRYPLWKARVNVLGGHKGYIWQSVGSCVGAGGDNMLGTLICIEIGLGQPEEYKHRWWPYTWGRSRSRAGMHGRGDGSTGAGWAEAIKEDGIFEHDPAGMADLPDFKEKGAWIQLPGSVELDWSAGERIKPEWIELGRKHVVKTVSPMRNAADCVEALANGYPITQASDFGFSPMVPRPQGDPPVRLVSWNGSWCLAPETKIPLLNGTEQTVEEMARQGGGWWVYSYDPPSGKVIPKLARAMRTRESVPEGMVRITLDNGEWVTTTVDHKFMTRTGKWVQAHKLRAGDSLMPLYRRLSTKADCRSRVGYEMVLDPGGRWAFTHLRVAESASLLGLRFKSGRLYDELVPGPAMAVVHHADLDKRNNDPTNLRKMLKREHWQYHATIVDPTWMWKARKDPAYCQRQAAAASKTIIELRRDAGFMAKLLAGASEAMKRLHADPEFRKRHAAQSSANMKALHADSEFRVAHSKRVKKMNRRSDIRAKRSASNVRRCADSEFKKRWIEALRRGWAKRRQRLAMPENHKVASVLFLPGETGPTYCLEVDGTHNFAVSAGVFVHNSHQTYIDEFWDHPTLGEIFRWGNNWGDAHGPALADEPPSSVYITAKTLDQICRNGEVYAFSAFDGFPARELNFSAF